MVAGKQPQRDWLTARRRTLHCARGVGIWEWAGTERRTSATAPDVVLACAGDVPTLETLAAAVDPARAAARPASCGSSTSSTSCGCCPTPSIRTGLPDREFDALFTTDRPVIFAFHGYPWLVHRLTYRRRNHAHLHVRGYKENGTTTTPFDMVMLNDLDRYHLVIDVIDRVPGSASRAAVLRQEMVDARLRARAWTPASTARTIPEVVRLDLAPAELRVLTVNAGSPSLKLSLVRTAPSVAAFADLDAAAADDPPDAVVHRVVHGGRPRGAGRRRRRRPRRARRAHRPGAAAPAARAAGDRPHRGRLARRAAGRLLRHRVPRHDPARRHDLRPAPTPTRPRRTRLRLPRPVPRLGAPRRAAELAPGARRVLVAHLGGGASLCARPRRPQRRHHDGLHAARRSGHGDPLRRARPRCRGCGSPRTPTRTSPTCSSGRAGCSACAAPPTCGRSIARAGAGDARRAARPRRVVPPPGAVVRGDGRRPRRSRRRRVHRRHRRAQRRRARRPAERLAWLGTGSTVPVLVVPAREDLQIAAETVQLLGSDS